MNGNSKGKGKKALIFDSSPIITLALNNLLDILPKLKKISKAKFFITPQVKRESIETPLKIKRFELEALMISKLIEDGTIEVINPIGLESATQKVLEMANNAYISEKETIKLVHVGEASCFAAKNLLLDYDCALVIDERTARVIAENPENLRELLQKKLHRPVSMLGRNVDFFKSTKIMRSSELALIAYKNKLIELPASPIVAVDALLYGVKLNGCSISYEEIEQMKKSFK